MPDTHKYICLVLGQTHLMHGGPFNIYRNQNLDHQLPLKVGSCSSWHTNLEWWAIILTQYYQNYHVDTSPGGVVDVSKESSRLKMEFLSSSSAVGLNFAIGCNKLCKKNQGIFHESTLIIDKRNMCMFITFINNRVLPESASANKKHYVQNLWEKFVQQI